MKNILLILGSPRGRASYSHQIGRRVVDDLKSRYPSAKVVVRNLTKEPLPEVSDAFVTGRLLAQDQRTAAEAHALALSDVLVGELMAADVLVLATPMHNFGISASVKAWIDHIVRPGVTYSDKGPMGLVRDKKAVLVLARGGIYAEGPMKPYDFQEPYLRTVLGFIGMTDVEVIRIEGVAMGDDAVRNAVTSAKAQADAVVRLIASGASVPALAEAA
ncbi:MAG TPA: FMN-dependent NADH-azoreductase [Casimicrobiaceae bacterium]|jgi:FMN-dependent NADH-azoreductase